MGRNGSGEMKSTAFGFKVGAIDETAGLKRGILRKKSTSQGIGLFDIKMKKRGKSDGRRKKSGEGRKTEMGIEKKMGKKSGKEKTGKGERLEMERVRLVGNGWREKRGIENARENKILKGEIGEHSDGNFLKDLCARNGGK
jgi:hypothetical protein